ncbi:sensor histidine kinase [Nannocystis punicea]|uniref:histidine kinase n=1 Tax=Nannocystis punicea TaxID=2995304 RepID=A0ABY7HCK5_9BACT|nr:HAMP domain-containing sensor histidine kinase [Nannocystis poenicansa]WAS96842.1 HAMP domain-containing sensor histidine kinase [Nannocystis poenicansa]
MAELEQALATRETQASSAAEFRRSLYEAYVYGLGRTLSLYDPASVRVLVREMGRRIREYLEEVGYDLGGAGTLDEVLEKTIGFFVDHGFVDLEVVRWENNLIQARWHRLLGLRAYERIVAAGGETFISCPLSAVIHDGLAAFGKELELVKNTFHVERGYVESWEAVVDTPTEEPREPLSLDAERMFALEREQSRQLRVRDEFIRIASHELSTPLTATKLALRRLESAELPEAARHPVAVLHRQLRRLELLVSEMLDTTRLQIGRIRLERAEVDLVAVTQGVIELLSASEMVEPGEIRLHGTTSAVGLWDAGRLDQIVTNLLTNAIKYGERRPIDVTITLHGDEARLQVADRGIGIAPEALERIFDPFERAAPVETHGGLGLGLYIARRFVEMHGGRIAVDSRPGAGATFTVDLPRTLPPAPGWRVERSVEARESTP